MGFFDLFRRPGNVQGVDYSEENLESGKLQVLGALDKMKEYYQRSLQMKLRD